MKSVLHPVPRAVATVMLWVPLALLLAEWQWRPVPSGSYFHPEVIGRPGDQKTVQPMKDPSSIRGSLCYPAKIENVVVKSELVEETAANAARLVEDPNGLVDLRLGDNDRRLIVLHAHIDCVRTHCDHSSYRRQDRTGHCEQLCERTAHGSTVTDAHSETARTLPILSHKQSYPVA